MFTFLLVECGPWTGAGHVVTFRFRGCVAASNWCASYCRAMPQRRYANYFAFFPLVFVFHRSLFSIALSRLERKMWKVAGRSFSRLRPFLFFFLFVSLILSLSLGLGGFFCVVGARANSTDFSIRSKFDASWPAYGLLHLIGRERVLQH